MAQEGEYVWKPGDAPFPEVIHVPPAHVGPFPKQPAWKHPLEGGGKMVMTIENGRLSVVKEKPFPVAEVGIVVCLILAFNLLMALFLMWARGGFPKVEWSDKENRK